MKIVAKEYIDKSIVKDLPKEMDVWAFFNPQWKKMTGIKSVRPQDVYRKVTQLITNQSEREEVVCENSNTQSDNASTTSVFAHLCDTSHRDVSQAEIEMKRYLDYPISSEHDFNVLRWWNAHKHIFPRLYKQFREIAAIAATSAAIERLFSHGGNTMVAKRNRLDPADLEEIVFLTKINFFNYLTV